MNILTLNGNALHLPLPDKSAQCCITSPPYWGLRDYGVSGQLGLESTPDEYVANIVAAMREVWRVLRDDGVLWLNLGDNYAGSGNGWQKDKSTLPRPWLLEARPGGETGRPPGYISSRQDSGLKPKDLVGIPWLVAFALRADGWYLRSEIIWHKPNPMPESVTDRPTKAHEQVFLLAKQERYYYDYVAIAEETNDTSGREDNPRNARTIPEISEGPSLFGKIQEIGETQSGCSPILRGRKGEGHHQEISDNGQGKRISVKGSPQEACGDESDNMRPNSIGMVGNQEASTQQMRNMREGNRADQRSYNSIEKGRTAYREEHSGIMQELQQQKKRSIATRNRRSVWTIATSPFSGAHFATFPPALVEPMVLAGTSPQACESCGAPWERITEHEQFGRAYTESQLEDGIHERSSAKSLATKRQAYRRAGMESPPMPVTIGWRPTCNCPPEHNTGSGKCIVIDPFAGTSTVGRVCAKHGRSFVGTELNPAYIELAQDRTSGVQISMGVTC